MPTKQPRKTKPVSDDAPDMSEALTRGFDYLPKGYPDDLGPDARAIRKRLGMTQQSFAESFGIPLATLRNWEQGRTVPDQPARTLLAVIARDPEAVKSSLRAA